MRSFFVLFLVALISSAFAQVCGPAQCYNGCTDARVPLDLVFIIDVSGSMQEEINGVRNGLTKFVQDLLLKNVNPTYTVIVYGNNNDQAVVLLNAETDFGKFKSKMDSITVDGGWEPAFETIRRACNVASSSSNFNIKYRSGSKRVIILLTDEDSDPAYFSSNRFQSSTTREACPPSNWPEWQSEIDSTAQAILNLGATVYLLVDVDTSTDFRTSQTCLTTRQFGDINHQVQSADFKTFDLVGTRNNIRASSFPNNLQGKLLEAARLCRVFDVDSADDPTLVKNFFETITADVSQCDSCMRYDCVNGQCASPVNICGCDNVPNSGKTFDSYGNCCLPTERDCAGRCFGKQVYDACGVCVDAKTTSPLCQEDCGARKYLTAKPTFYMTPENLRPDSAGYLLSNSDLYNAFASPSGSLRSIDALQKHFNDFGRFEGRTTCDFDANRYAADHNVPAASAKDNWLNSLLANTALNTKPAAYCVPNTRRKITNRDTDECGQCILLIESPPYCVRDCSNVLRTNPQLAFFVDNCGKCVSPSTSPDGNKDDCGVCFGNNANKNQCGECFGSKALDGCSNPVCQGKVCNINCDGKSEEVLTKQLDECGKCVDIAKVRDPSCVQDCAGNYFLQPNNPPFRVDECGNCVPYDQVRLPECKQDCAGVWNGTAYYDSCDQCIDGKDDFPCLTDCSGLFYRLGKDTPVYTLDDCSECNTLANRNKLKDLCGVCTNKLGYNSTAECTPDCKGIYTLPAGPRSFLDLCQDCWFANETNFFNYRMDDCGICHPTRDDPDWNENQAVDDNGNKCACFTTPNQCEDPVTGIFTDLCLDCPTFSPCPGGGVKDDCGLCPSSPMYGKKDKCGLCCDPPAVPCDIDVDDCGVCFGFNKAKETNPCKICDAAKCVVDCKGVPFGSAKIGCDLICDSNAVCLFCGDGITSPELGETCDLGNGKNTEGSGCFNCSTESGNSNRGSIIGGVLGGLAAVAFLALSGFMAFQYAKKNGLIGKAGQKLDMSASNSNPLYKGDTSIQQNPLYGN